MAVSAQAAQFGFGPQAGKESPATDFYRHRALALDLSPMDETREGQPEIGGLAVPTFPYKPGPIIAGGASLQPRLQDTFGWLLYAALGKKDSSTPLTGNTDVIDHKFVIDPDNSTFLPWISVRKHIPKKDADPATDLGELYTDCKVTGMMLNMANDQPLVARMDVLGRKFSLDDNPDAWVWQNTFEDWRSVPVMCAVGGFIKIGGTELSVVAANVSLQNSPLDIRSEKVIGDPFLEDVTIIQRRLAYQLTVKWNNPDLYRQVLAGDPAGTEWSSHPTTAEFDVNVVSSVDMPNETDLPYSLTVHADEAMLSHVGGIQLAGNNAVLLNFQGVALEQTEYCSFVLRNKVTDYIWPVSS